MEFLDFIICNDQFKDYELEDMIIMDMLDEDDGEDLYVNHCEE